MTWLIRNVLFVGGLWILYSRLMINHKAAPDPAVDGERKEMDTQVDGRLSYYYEPGKGRPLVLLHSVNAAASSYEMKPLFEHYRGQRPVYALDLPGYGFSEHSPREYTPEVFSTAIAEFLLTQVGKAADVVALSLSAEFAARVARDNPELFHSLALISPSGMTMRARQAGPSQRMHEIFAAPLWGQALFDLIATPRQYPLLPAAQLRRARAGRPDRLRLHHQPPAGRGDRAAVFHQRSPVHPGCAGEPLQEGERSRAGDLRPGCVRRVRWAARPAGDLP